MEILFVFVMVLIGLTVACLVISLSHSHGASRAFEHYHKAACAAGIEAEFIMRFNSIAKYGDSIENIIDTLGASRIREIFKEAMATKK